MKRNLLDEFDQLGNVSHALPAAPAVPSPMATPVHASSPASTPGVQSNGSSSSTTLPMLCSITPPWTGGCVGGVTSTPGWPEARLDGSLDGNMLQASQLYCGSTSGLPYQLSLSSSPQYGMGLPVHVFQSQLPPAQPPPGGSPAYCFHRLQYGSVFNITQCEDKKHCYSTMNST